MLITGPIDARQMTLQRLALHLLPRPVASTIEAVVPPPAAMAQPQVPTSVAMLVAIAAIDPRAQRQRATAAVEKGLRGLEILNAELRVGPARAARLGAIAAWMGDHSVPDDPDAAALLREVELRVLVELAKAERDQ